MNKLRSEDDGGDVPASQGSTVENLVKSKLDALTLFTEHVRWAEAEVHIIPGSPQLGRVSRRTLRQGVTFTLNFEYVQPLTG